MAIQILSACSLIWSTRVAISYEEELGRRSAVKLLTQDEARRITLREAIGFDLWHLRHIKPSGRHEPDPALFRCGWRELL